LEILKSFSETQILISDTQIPSIFKSHNTYHHIHIENGSITTMNSNQHQ